MEAKFEGFEEEDVFIIKQALAHYRNRLISFKEDESIKILSQKGENICRDVGFDIHQIDELLKYMIPERKDLGGKPAKLRVYLTVITSALRQFSADLIEMKRIFRSEFPESLLSLDNVGDALDEVSRVLSTYEILRIRPRFSI